METSQITPERERRALWSVAAQFFANGAIAGSYVPRLPEIRDRLDIGTDVLGVLLSIAAATGLVGSVLVGVLIGRFGSRRVLLISATLMTLSLAMIGVSASIPLFVIALAGVSICDVLADSAMNIQGSQLSARRRVPVMNRLHGLWSVGTLVGGLASAQLAGWDVSLQTHMLWASVVMIGVIAFVATGLLDEDLSYPADSSLSANPTVGANSKRRGLILLAIAAGCSIAMELTTNDWAAFRLSEDFEASARVAGFAYVSFTVGMVAGRFGGDWAVDRFGADMIIRVSLVLTLVGLAVSSFASLYWIVLIAFAVAGLGISPQFPRLYDDAARHPGRRGAGLGALTGGSKIALLLTPLIIGPLAATGLSVGTAMAIVTLPAGVIFLAIRIGRG